MIRSIAVTIAAMAASHSIADEACGPFRYVSPPHIPATHFGSAVASTGDFWFVGDSQGFTPCGGSPTGCRTGAVHVYEMVGGELVYRQLLVPDDAGGDRFGISLDAHGDRLVVGSYFTDWPTTEGRGGGFIYDFDGEQWVEAGRLVPPPEVTREGAGSEVALHGDLAVLSPYGTPAKYAYKRGPAGWEILQPIQPPGGGTRTGFGLGVVITDDWLFASDKLDSSQVREGGSVFVFKRQPDGTITFSQKLEPVDPGESREFGSVIDSDGRTLAVGYRKADRVVESQGAVLIYELEGDQWTLRQEINQRDPEQGDRLGGMLAVEGDTLLARVDRSDAVQDGDVRVFRRDALGHWREDGRLVANPVGYAGFFGTAMALNGSHALMGAREDWDGSGTTGSDFPGAAYLFNLDCIGCPPDFDADGTLTIFDFLSFFNLFEEGEAQADFDGDGELTIFDFLAFQTAFDAGCS